MMQFHLRMHYVMQLHEKIDFWYNTQKKFLNLQIIIEKTES